MDETSSERRIAALEKAVREMRWIKVNDFAGETDDAKLATTKLYAADKGGLVTLIHRNRCKCREHRP